MPFNDLDLPKDLKLDPIPPDEEEPDLFFPEPITRLVLAFDDSGAEEEWAELEAESPLAVVDAGTNDDRWSSIRPD